MKERNNRRKSIRTREILQNYKKRDSEYERLSYFDTHDVIYFITMRIFNANANSNAAISFLYGWNMLHDIEVSLYYTHILFYIFL